ncbi:hypothetical protein DIPPA_35075 [Diplonema papillatum]|nr:hypothetical protein DIPPA_35075 [Diplonema papillatum]
MGRGKGKTLTPQELRKKLAGPKKEGSAKNTRKAVTSGAKRGRVGPGEDAPTGVTEARLLHPKSRRAKQLMRGFHNESKRATASSARDRKKRDRATRFAYFKQAVEARPEWNARKSLDADIAKELTLQYVVRNDAELQELREKRAGTHAFRANRNVVSGREKEILAIREEEATQLKHGVLEVPRMISKAGLSALRQWDESPDTLHVVVTTAIQIAEVPAPVQTPDTVSFSRMVELKKKLEARAAKKKAAKPLATTVTVDTAAKTKERGEVQVAVQKKAKALARALRRGHEAPQQAKPQPKVKKSQDLAQKRAEVAAKHEGFAFAAPST